MKFRILGCGPSLGVPSLDMNYGLCDPTNPKNNRTRSSLLLNTDDHKTLLFDTTPDIRMQLIKAHHFYQKIDAILYTHPHYDHIGGADEIRVLTKKDEQMPVYMTQECQDVFGQSVYYLMPPASQQLDLHQIEYHKPFYIGNNEIIPIKQNHGGMFSTGYRIGDFAYTTDVKEFDKAGWDVLKGVKTWVLGVVCVIPSHKHAGLETALQWIEEIKPKRVYLTHMGYRLDYEKLLKQLPSFVKPCYDGLEVEL